MPTGSTISSSSARGTSTLQSRRAASSASVSRVLHSATKPSMDGLTFSSNQLGAFRAACRSS
ncbi:MULTISPECIES: hypothetical protein [unclassified Streptomyces]|uniref:hypothetical protein n=1 Tax=unclassified Streptomyces TaxID=2593676 RepID=UPI000966443D|nr:hypothetical protein [Streptomyces sp. CB01883]OKJ74356.1 hypothetical protein AMK32_35770 [Streptomyces sp. CB01883]